MDTFEKLKSHLPEIGKIVATFPPTLQEKVYSNLVSALLDKKEDIIVTKVSANNSISQTHSEIPDDIPTIATLTPEGEFHSSIRDLKAKNAAEAVKRLVYVLIRSYTKLMNSSSVSRKKIINPEIVKWRLANGHDRAFIASDKGIIKKGDQLSLDIHAQSEADQYIRDIMDPEISGSWKPGTTKRKQRVNNNSESDEGGNQDSVSNERETKPHIQIISNNKPQPHTKDEIKTTSTIAQILDANSEDELILAAAMKFDLIDEKETFNRKEILMEMQTATSYYKASYNNNASKRLKILVKREQKLRENAPGIYALSANTKTELRQKLGLE